MSDRGIQRPPDGHGGGFRLLALVAVSAGLVLLAAAAFALSYAGVHAVALSAGVSPRLARIYPLIFDAMLVVACAAVLSLRGAGLPSRCYAWVSLLVLLAVVAVADALHATNVALPHRPAAAAVAVIPWALVLIGFGLLLTMLRHARLRRAGLAAEPPAGPGGLAALGFSPAPPALPAGTGDAGSVTAGEPGFGAEQEAEFEAASDGGPENDAGFGSEASQPEFDRVRSSPVPPEA